MLKRKMRTMVWLVSVFGSLSAQLTGCASFTGYPHPFQDESAVIKADGPYLTADVREIGDAPTDIRRNGLSQQQYRDTVIYRRIEVIDNYYYNFEAKLTGAYNGVEVGSDLTALILNGFGAVTGSAGTKAALAAASAGVIGAKSAINTDLFYQKTIQSLIAQMRAARAQALLRIETGLSNPISKYSMDAALNDVNAYYVAGTLPSAIAQVTSNAGASEAAAKTGIDALRQVKYTTLSATGQKLVNWLFPGGDTTKAPNASNLTALTNWMQAYKQNPLVSQVPYIIFLDSPTFEADRAQAITDLKIP